MENTCFDCGSREFAHRIEKCARNREDVTLFGVDYMPYPLDAEGEPIRIGDVMEWPDYSTAEVVGIGNGTFFYVEDGEDAAEWSSASDKIHHHAPTVEDVLLDACKAYHGLMIESMSDVAHDMPAPSEVIAEYAAKLQLRED